MKKLLLSIALVVGGLSQLSAQCTITPGCTVGTGGYCTTPAANSNLPNATVGTPYSTTIQVSVGTSAGPATINNGTVTSVTGLPAGLTYSTNPTSGVINAGANGCILITGTPGTSSAGSYTITVNVNVSTNFGTSPASISWMLTVNPSGTTGIKEAQASSMIVMSPNPAKSELNLSADFTIGKVQIIDALGKLVLSHDGNYATQSTTINLDGLNTGVYFLQVNDGNRIISRKFIKE